MFTVDKNTEDYTTEEPETKICDRISTKGARINSLMSQANLKEKNLFCFLGRMLPAFQSRVCQLALILNCEYIKCTILIDARKI